jgi:hypothetical protein
MNEQDRRAAYLRQTGKGRLTPRQSRRDRHKKNHARAEAVARRQARRSRRV